MVFSKGFDFKNDDILKMTGAPFYMPEEKEEFEEEEVTPPRRPGEPPDGEWGWVVMIAAFFCCLFTEGILFSYLVLQMELSNYFEVTEESLTFIGVLMYAFSMFGGPFTSVLVKRFQFRKVVMAGSVVTCASMLVSTQISSIGPLHLTYGVLAGLGLSMVKLPSIMIIAYWFEKRRAFTTGIAVMGSGVGVFIFPPLYKHLLDIHDWKNATVLMGALFLNCAVAGALFRPLTHAKRKGMKRGPIQRGAIMKALIAEKERQRTISNGSLDNCIITRDNRLIKIDKIDLRNKSNSYIDRLKETFGFSSRSLNRSKNSLIVPKIAVQDPIYRPKSPRTSSNSRLSNVPKTSPPTPKRDSGCGSLEGSPKLTTNSYEALPTEDLVVNLPENHADNGASATDQSYISHLDAKRSPRKFRSAGASPVGSECNVPLNYRSPSLLSQTSKMTDLSVPMQGSIMTVPGVQSSYEMSSVEEDVLTDCKLLRKLYKWFNLKLLKRPSFLLLAAISFITMIGYTLPLTHLKVKGLALGISKDKSQFLISILWVANMIGRIAFGWIADRPWASAIHLNNVMILLAGFLSLFCQFFNNNSLLGFYAAFFGLFTATFFTLRSIMLIELFGKDKLIASLGLLAFFQGLAVLTSYEIGRHVGGDLPFYIVGILLVSAGLLGFMLPKVELWKLQRSNELEIVHIEEITPPHEEVLQVENIESNV